MDDLRDECDAHAPGAVQGVKVPRPPEPQLAEQYMGQGNYGKVGEKGDRLGVGPGASRLGTVRDVGVQTWRPKGWAAACVPHVPNLQPAPPRSCRCRTSYGCCNIPHCSSAVLENGIPFADEVQPCCNTHCVQAFVSFSAPTAAQRARAAIHGRLFAGNTVSVSYITAEEFDQV